MQKPNRILLKKLKVIERDYIVGVLSFNIRLV